MFKKSNRVFIAPEDRVPVSRKIAYAMGGPVDVLGVWVLISIAYQVFNMELGMRPTYVAIILMALRLWDGILDPIMGWISDNTRTRWGRRRPFILIGSILAGLFYPLIWWFPHDLSDVQLMLWVIGFGILFYSCFTVWAIPYQSLLMEMTPDYNERTRVTAYRSILQTLAGLLNGWIWWISLRQIFAGDADPSAAHGMRYISIAIGIIIIVFGVIPALFVKERYYESDVIQKQKKIKLVQSFKETFSNKPFIVLVLVTFFFLMGQSIFDGYGRYVGTFYVLEGNKDLGSMFAGYGTFIYTAFSLLFIPVFRKLSEKIGKNVVLMIAIGIVIIAYGSTWWTFTPSNPWLMLLSNVFIGAGYAGLWLMLPSMQVDVVDYDEVKTGERREGSFASIYSWVLKLSFMAGFLVSGPLLEVTGFKIHLEANQPEYVFTNMRVGFFLIPLISLIVAFVMLQYFPITAKKAAQIRERLEERRGKV